MRLLKLGTAVILLAAVLAPAALADQPAVTITPWDRTRTIAASPDTCPFDIVVHSSGTFRETVYSDGTDATRVSDFHITWTNPASGKSIHSVLAGPEIVQPNGDGTVTVTVNGVNGLFTGQGQGLLFADAGRLVYIASAADPSTPLQILQSSGHQDTSLFPAVCGALE
jgi:hypothetical protein